MVGQRLVCHEEDGTVLWVVLVLRILYKNATSVFVSPLALKLQECWCLLSREDYSDCPNTRLFANWVHITVSVPGASVAGP